MKTVSIVEIGGKKLLSGGSGLAVGEVTEEKRAGIKAIVQERQFGHVDQDKVEEAQVPEMDREVVSGIILRKVALESADWCSTPQCSVPRPATRSSLGTPTSGSRWKRITRSTATSASLAAVS